MEQKSYSTVNENISSVVVTGAAGMIGLALIRLCISRGIRVLAVIRPDSDCLSRFPESELLKTVECDAGDYASLVSDERYDAFFHLAWAKTTGIRRNDAAAQCRNIENTIAACEAAKRLGCKVFIGAGSQAEYGSCSSQLSPSTAANPQSGYGIAKYAAGKLSRISCGQLGLRHCWVRILSVYGEYDNKNSLIMYCLERMLSGQPAELTQCEQIWDYLYCGDAARALLSTAQRGKDGAVYCLGSGECRPLREYVEDMAHATGTSSPILYGSREYYPQQAMYLHADISSLTADTGFVPETSFEKGIGYTIKWLRSFAN